MKFLLTIIVLLAATVSLSAQTRLSDAGDKRPLGNIRSVTYQRTYLIYKRKHVDPVAQKLSTYSYDRAGNMTQVSTFGNAERRVVFEHSRGEVRTRIFFFDLAGSPIFTQGYDFSPPWDEVERNDLCTEFSTRVEKDVVGKVEFETDTCIDGTVRSTVRTELGEHNYVYREFFKDAKNRTKDTLYEYDANGVETRYTYTINNLRTSEYWMDVRYADTKFDSNKNWIRSIATAVSSSAPNEPAYQYIQEQLITYYE
jgi:hypothetical protein